MRVMIFETDHRGHRLTFIRLLATALKELADEVVISLPAAAPDSPEFKSQLAGLVNDVQIDATLPPLPEHSPQAEAKAKLKVLRETVERIRPERLYLPTADAITQIAGVARLGGVHYVRKEVEVEGLLLQGRIGYPAENWRERFRNAANLAAMSLAPWSRMFFLDPFAYEAIRHRGGGLAQRSRLMPDPVESRPARERSQARQRLNLPIDGRYLGCIGLMDERKGIDLLIPAFALSMRNPSDRLLLAGRLGPRIRDLLNGPFAELVQSGRVIALDRYLNEDELYDAMAALNVVCATYPAHTGSASLVIRAAQANLPVLASDYGWTGMIVPRFGLGSTVNVHDPNALTQAIKQSFDAAQEFSLNEAARRFIAFHTPENFAAAWTAGLRDRMNLPPPSNVLTWEWVMQVIDPSIIDACAHRR